MNRWQRIQELFEECSQLDANGRETFWATHPQVDDALRSEVQALLQADVEELPKLDGTATQLFESLGSEPPAEDLCGIEFDAYRIEEHLSTGGMGHVYRATRTTSGTERRVALKVLRPRLDTGAFLERFDRERQALAVLEHEHIVTFLDAGTLPDGRPYLVMELVEGVSLTTWAGGATLEERIRLFLQVLAAVQYAHQNLIVHQDIKPSNVLVTAKGAPKLLDFGVATILAGEVEPSAEDTEASYERGPATPGYASPEQLAGGKISTTSDVFSLGTLLHELLTGALPEGPEGSKTGLDPDLGAIIGKARELSPLGRYRSADLMADDLRRFLERMPISARSPGLLYRARLFTARHLWPIALGAAVVLALVTGWVGSDLDRRRAEVEATRGWGAHAQAKVVARVFENWIATTAAEDPALGAAATRHLESFLGSGLHELPETEALLRLTLADLYLERGDVDRARDHVDRAWVLAQDTRGIGTEDRERAAALRTRIGAGN